MNFSRFCDAENDLEAAAVSYRDHILMPKALKHPKSHDWYAMQCRDCVAYSGAPGIALTPFCCAVVPCHYLTQ